jgi:hypothetical protein
VADRWERERVLALAPDASSQRSAQSLATANSWLTTGSAEPHALWGACRGSAATPYRTVVDLSGPAYKCSCPSRKFPCKHALALLLLWARGEVGSGTDMPEWAATWLTSRTAKGNAGPGTAAPAEPVDPAAALRRAEQREARVAAGLDELDQWLRDQVRQGLAATPRAGYRHWDTIAARMVDAQASGLAERLRSLAGVPHSGAGWESRLLEEYALLRLLITAYRRRADLPGGLVATVRSRIGFTVRQADVLAGGERVTGRWHVLARRDLELDRIRTRRTWLRGHESGRFALVLSFAATGESFDNSLTAGTEAVLELAFYPGALPLRALVVASQAATTTAPPAGGMVKDMLASWAQALSHDPWLDSWPVVLTAVTPVRGPASGLADANGDTAPLHPGAGDCWPLFAVSGGAPLTVAAEWTTRGLWPLTAWDQAGRAVGL